MPSPPLQVVGERLFFESHSDLYEAIAAATLHNALRLFEEWGVLQAAVGGEGGGAPTTTTRLRLAEVLGGGVEVAGGKRGF